MQSPARPNGRRGFVTATKHFVLESIRVRNCDPGANDRWLIDRAAGRWNFDLERDCEGQSSGLRAPGWPFVIEHDHSLRFAVNDGVELPFEPQSSVAPAAAVTGSSLCGSAPHHGVQRSLPCQPADREPTDLRTAASLFDVVCASDRMLPFLSLPVPVAFSRKPNTPAVVADDDRTVFWRSNRDRMAMVGSQNGQRTHSFIRMSHEKRNADECPPTGGKSNRHR